ncbi:hypothetical protein CDAR_381381 [Caerostris darwini]|uniref:Uncharacterized protein n=1 Tax=Caerostris darwini TaxID=1538125 RepID=A0AAV4PHJ8_9ARAC|nr:hypothetical protein CDAR_381381 [Caerostris darwini]
MLQHLGPPEVRSIHSRLERNTSSTTDIVLDEKKKIPFNSLKGSLQFKWLCRQFLGFFQVWRLFSSLLEKRGFSANTRMDFYRRGAIRLLKCGQLAFFGERFKR